METLEIRLDGYTDLPPGKIANVVTYLEMSAPPAPRPAPDRPDLAFRQSPSPDVGWYRATIRAIGEAWLWFSPLVMPEAELAALLARPARSRSTRSSATARPSASPSSTGASPARSRSRSSASSATEIGTGRGALPDGPGAGAGLRTGGTRRVWLHTCTFDHPAAVPFYLRVGFTPFKFAIEVTDDPRLTGHLPETAGPHVALIRPDADAGRPSSRAVSAPRRSGLRRPRSRPRSWSRSAIASIFSSSCSASAHSATARRELSLQFLDRGEQVVAALDRRLGEGRIGEMRGVADAAPLLLGDDLVVEFLRHALELGDHRLDLRDLPALLVDLEALQADQPITRLHDQRTLPHTPS